jgi:hypothetical protein
MMMISVRRTTAVLLIVALTLTTLCSCFTTTPHGSVKRGTVCCHATKEQQSSARRILVTAAAPLFFFSSTSPALAADNTNTNLLPLIQQARRQLDAVPDLIEKEKWDSVRAILITPPLSECWTKNTKMLRTYAETVEDELAALEAREDVVSHLRFLDMAVYNNVFNPIATEGTSGATKELIRSYYEDPINEWRASVAALEELIQLGIE